MSRTRLTVTAPAAGVQVLTLDGPERRNALGVALATELELAISAAYNDDVVRAIVITGVGGVFCAGADIKNPDAVTVLATSRARRLGLLHRPLEALHRIPKPTITAVEGAAIGVGWSMALACDMTVAAEDAYFHAPFIDRGLVPDGGCAWLLSRAVGTRRAAQLLMLGERVSAAAAYKLGLVNAVVPPSTALEEAVSLAGRLAAGPADALALTKRLLSAAERTADYGSFLEQEWTAAALCMSGPDPAEGRSAFLERRKPDFTPPSTVADPH